MGRFETTSLTTGKPTNGVDQTVGPTHPPSINQSPQNSSLKKKKAYLHTVISRDHEYSANHEDTLDRAGESAQEESTGVPFFPGG